ncbi:MAG: efflux RND transporter periplasmic adaptor subunit [candidate division KSB1 bacterium]|nr:efflux RND transporter periplasmic adaptor subunit [candidate division KSB1 bacterium]
MSKKKIIIGVVLLLVIGAMVFVNLRKRHGDVTKVTVTKVKKGSITESVSGSGYIQPELDVEISARISAEIIEIHIKEGDTVKKGELLVDLDRQRYEALLERAESGVLSAEATLKKAMADYNRIKQLYDQDLKSQAELDAAEADMMLAKSQLQQTRASLREAGDNLAKTRLVAPINGVVTKLNKEEGEIAVGSEFQADPIMTVSDLSQMEVLAEIDENDVVLVELDDIAKIEVDAIPDTALEGTVSEIAHTATTLGRGTQEQVTNFEVKIAITTPFKALRPGMSSTVDIETETRDSTLYVPIQCVTMREVDQDSTSRPKDKEEKQKVVFVVQADTVQLTPVTTGISSETDIEVLTGLQEGDQVVTGSYKVISQTLKGGDAVNIQKSPEKNDNSEE